MKRLNYDANSDADIWQYFQTRARQILSDGFIWSGKVNSIEGGLSTTFSKDGVEYGSFYGRMNERGQGHARRHFSSLAPIVTTLDCKIKDFLSAHQIPHVVVGSFLETEEYKIVEQFYADKTTKRTGMFMMNHIDEGLFVLNHYGATEAAKKAFCLHPLLQMDTDLALNWSSLRAHSSPEVLGLALEYRNIANQYLSQRSISSIDEIKLSPLEEVDDMLRADKVQNYKDFLIYHKATHPRADILNTYFLNWFERLNIPLLEWESLQNNLKSIEFKPPPHF